MVLQLVGVTGAVHKQAGDLIVFAVQHRQGCFVCVVSCRFWLGLQVGSMKGDAHLLVCLQCLRLAAVALV